MRPGGNITPLSGLTGLTTLWLGNNTIADYGALSGFVNLTHLSLRGTGTLTDIPFLLDNPGLGPGDTVDLVGTGVSCADVTALRAKGVTVDADNCPA